VATPEELEALEDSVIETVTGGVQSATTGDQSTTIIDPEKLLRVRDKLAARAVTSTSSGWGMVRQARAVPPGADPS
jgi:hypothetical protein